MKAKDYLLQLKKLDCLIDNKIAEKAYWMDIAYSTTAAGSRTVKIKNSKGEYEEHAMSRVQSSGNQQKMSDAVDRCIDIDRDIDACIDRLCDERKKIISVIEQLEVVEYDLLHKVYVGVLKKTPHGNKRYYYTLDDIAEYFGKSRSWADTKHGVALKHVQKIIDSCADCEKL